MENYSFPETNSSCADCTVRGHGGLNMSTPPLSPRFYVTVTLMVVVILAVCLFCWTPYHLSTVVALITDIPQTPFIIGISYFITSLSYANSCFNPFLYAFLDDSFRRSFRKLIDRRTTS